MRRFLVFAAVAPFALNIAGCSGAVTERQTGNVVLVTLDGARWQDVFTGLDEAILASTLGQNADVKATQVTREFGGATPVERREKLMPFLFRTLAARHGFLAGDRSAGSAMAVTNRHWFSYPGYSEILTGQPHDDVIRSNDAIRNPFPSVLQFVKRKQQLTPAQVATFASWNVIASIAESEPGATTTNAGVQAYASEAADVRAIDDLQRQVPTPWANTRHDAFTFRFALDYLKRQKPRVLYISFDETDDWAHDGKYDLVLNTLHRTDAWLAELWDALQADPHYRDRTTLIVTVDHGRGRTPQDWRSHGANIAGADEIWMAVASPHTKRRGIWSNSPALFQNQIAATIAAALGLDYAEQNPEAGRPIAIQ